MIGHLLNVIIPLRVSPLVRAYMIQMKEGIPTSTALATVAVDRLADGLVSVGLLAALLVFMSLPRSLADIHATLVTAGWVLLGVYVAVVVLLVLAARAPCAGGRIYLAAGRPLPRRWRAWLVREGRRFARGLTIPRSAWGRAGVVLFALAHKMTQVWQIQVAARAFNIDLGAVAGLFLVLFLGATVIAAGMLGIRGGYYVATVVARRLARVGGQDCDGPCVQQAPIGSRPIRSAGCHTIRRRAMTDRSIARTVGQSG